MLACLCGGAVREVASGRSDTNRVQEMNDVAHCSCSTSVVVAGGTHLDVCWDMSNAMPLTSHPGGADRTGWWAMCLVPAMSLVLSLHPSETISPPHRLTVSSSVLVTSAARSRDGCGWIGARSARGLGNSWHRLFRGCMRADGCQMDVWAARGWRWPARAHLRDGIACRKPCPYIVKE